MPAITHERIGQYLKTALQALEDNGGSLRSRNVREQVGDKLILDEYELERYEKSGDIRWETTLDFYSISCVKAGWIVKDKGTWTLTDSGRAVLELSEKDLFDESENQYALWYRDAHPPESENGSLINPESWSAFTGWAKQIFDWDGFDEAERNYKLEISQKLSKARDSFLSKQGDWIALLREAFGPPNNLTPWRTHVPFLDLLSENQNIAERALSEIWKPDRDLTSYQNTSTAGDRLNEMTVQYSIERLGNFISVLTEISSVSEIRFSMPEVLGSFLLMGIDPLNYPIYRADPLRKAYRLANGTPLPRGSTPVDRYEYGMRFLNEVFEHCNDQEIGLRDLLDAQCIVWEITKGNPPDHWSESQKEDFLRFRGETPEAPETPVVIDPDINYWMVGSLVGDIDHRPRFIDDGVWENHNENHADLVRSMKAGDRIALRSRGAQKSGLPFDNFGQTVSKYYIHVIGTITANSEDGKSVHVDWEEPGPMREWYLYTLIASVWRLPKGLGSMGPHLIRFTFFGIDQDFEYFSEIWWPKDSAKRRPEQDELIPYSPEDVLKEGVFLTLPEVELIIRRMNTKRNVILQGAPGVGKTFVTRKLAYALMGSKDDTKITTIQLHPSYSYEDFVRGYRPTEEAGRFEMKDGPFLEVCEAAYGEPDQKFVIIIDEINRGNLSQVFGEMFSLLESDKRGRSHEITPLYRRSAEDRVSVPENVFVIGTMNIADRSLALVDYALRRRFAFITLEPKFKAPAYRDWLIEREMDPPLVDRIITSMTALNEKISADRQLGRAYQIGHSFFCPPGEEFSILGLDWFEEIISTEIRPLVEEYWFDEPDKVQSTFSEVFGSL